jgi:hypothetical protein
VPPGVPDAAVCVALANGTLSCADLDAGPECYYQPVLGEKYLSYTLEIRERLPALWCLVAFSLAVSSASLVVLLVFRDRAVVRMSQWAFTLVATCGLVALNVGSAAKLAGSFSINGGSGGNWYCVAFLSLFYLGDQAIYMALLSKTLRAWRMHENSRRLRPSDFHAWHGWLMLCVSILVVAVLLVVWFTVRTPPRSTCERLGCQGNPFREFEQPGRKCLFVLVGVVSVGAALIVDLTAPACLPAACLSASADIAFVIVDPKNPYREFEQPGAQGLVRACFVLVIGWCCPDC